MHESIKSVISHLIKHLYPVSVSFKMFLNLVLNGVSGGVQYNQNVHVLCSLMRNLACVNKCEYWLSQATCVASKWFGSH